MVGEDDREGLAARKFDRRLLISSFGVTLRDRPSSSIVIASLIRPARRKKWYI